ncbi:hypothetical protein Bpfe_000684 [Biomphalaria pfeifferi]|uniref:Uncharacterized protein n=1 Tax=Biomphalaria pfeifferi TaxID=112525 RepID=A0AAD8CAX7_BIOPF|nr:hypothetical protein Bpfe_000684 [Biomphalaria pfeifferi]
MDRMSSNFFLFYGLFLLFCGSSSELGMAYKVIDKSKSKYCTTGLLETRDIVILEVIIDTSGMNVTREDRFVLEVYDVDSSSIVKLCDLDYDERCAMGGEDVCYCDKYREHIFTFKYMSRARIQYHGWLLRINGRLVDDVTYPNVYTDRYDVSLTINDIQVNFSRTCTVDIPAESTAKFQLCTKGLNQPVMFITYAGSQEWSNSSQNCLNVSYVVLKSNHLIWLRYEDACRRNATMFCYVKGFSLNSLDRDITFSVYELKLVIACVAVSVLTLSIAAMIYCRRRVTRLSSTPMSSISFEHASKKPSRFSFRLSKQSSSSHTRIRSEDINQGTPV